MIKLFFHELDYSLVPTNQKEIGKRSIINKCLWFFLITNSLVTYSSFILSNTAFAFSLLGSNSIDLVYISIASGF
ncbi:hypothetical protein Celal_0168 [Cellulophaga algicola DSM 14237]|uniref:Uncharacterized protein n=1 Tax=Cellulophaga algicola (strain DSM 14237 / IC166 / ACAM 630) TaxID=688270 RepID=E6X7S6_CELAD|nr:hypothetical protein Celal_0168 [Cellulophaga algicola DSM 14237]